MTKADKIWELQRQVFNQDEIGTLSHSVRELADAINKRIDAVENYVDERAEGINDCGVATDKRVADHTRRLNELAERLDQTVAAVSDLQNQDDTIQNGDATFKVGDKVTSLDGSITGEIKYVDGEDDALFFVVPDGDIGAYWAFAAELHHAAVTFNVGDRVEATDDGGHCSGFGRVTSIDTDDTAYPYRVILEDGQNIWFRPDELRAVSPPFPATGNTPVAETFKVGDRIVVAHAAYKKYAGRMGCVSSVGHTAQGVVQYSVDFDGEDCTVYFFPADELRHADSDALDVDVTAYAGVIHTNASGERFHVIPEGDFLESEHWRHAFNVEERESLDMRQALDRAEARVKQVESDMADERLYGAGMRDAAARLHARAEDAERQLTESLGSYREEVTRLRQERDNLITEARDMDQLEARLADARQERNELRSQVIELRVQLQRARSSQRIDPARAGLSRIETGDFDWVGSDDE